MAIQFFNMIAFENQCLMKIITGLVVLNLCFKCVSCRFEFTLTEDDESQALVLDIAVNK